ncbi:Thiamine biosynthesis protein ThiS [Flavobacterium sp. 9AF]|uniref:sulfur carrier protein ThiS n=1 Tax=Flavobacterium sp. 9AF TaxID=2653142 RepID=UPI0012F32B05|nr:sulfur carrier protein ThiS [Flavobacterium sp. 9AF]VXB19465.1 Thiamine biosynthesis protein ThiS [Flavobacterium sp. 9AF]
MELKINNKNKTFDRPSLTIQELIDAELPTKQNGIAIAVNEMVVPKNQWEHYFLSPTDTILIITATQGG